MKHFYDTFGFVVIRNFFDPMEVGIYSREFDRLISATGIMACCADSSELLIKLIDRPMVVDAVGTLLGASWIYKGSDGNVFDRATPWHRDYFIRTPTCKILTYFDPSTLDVIPGSHFVDGPFSKQLNGALTWPEPPVNGGFDEKMLLSNDGVPCHRISTEPGDVIVFSHNLIHRTSIDGRRRLLGLHFASEFNEEIRDLTLIEMRTFGVERCYGPYVPYNDRTMSLWGLINKSASAFGGKYDQQSDESIRFGKRLM